MGSLFVLAEDGAGQQTIFKGKIYEKLDVFECDGIEITYSAEEMIMKYEEGISCDEQNIFPNQE